MSEADFSTALKLREVQGVDAELLHLSALLATMDNETPLPLAALPSVLCICMFVPS